jgi:hypothetical protein
MPQPQNPSRLDEASDALMHLAAQMGIDPTDPLVLVARGNARLEEKVEQWTQTKLQLLELLSQQVEEQQRSAQHYSKLIYYLNGFDGQLLGLHWAANRDSALGLEQMGSRHPDWDGASSDQAGYGADSADYPSLWHSAEELIDWGFQTPLTQSEPVKQPPEVEL